MTGHPPASETPGASRTGSIEKPLWIVLAGGAVMDAGLSLAGYELLSFPFGVAAVAAGAVLLIRHFRNRK